MKDRSKRYIQAQKARKKSLLSKEALQAMNRAVKAIQGLTRAIEKMGAWQHPKSMPGYPYGAERGGIAIVGERGGETILGNEPIYSRDLCDLPKADPVRTHDQILKALRDNLNDGMD